MSIDAREIVDIGRDVVVTDAWSAARRARSEGMRRTVAQAFREERVRGLLDPAGDARCPPGRRAAGCI